MTQPRDPMLYDIVRANIYNTIPRHSAYRSGLLVQEYKREFAKKYGPQVAPYTGTKPRKSGLSRWFAEDWRNESGGIGYDSTNTLYRPTKRVTAESPKTWSEIPKSRVASARKEKKTHGRVTRF